MKNFTAMSHEYLATSKAIQAKINDLRASMLLHGMTAKQERATLRRIEMLTDMYYETKSIGRHIARYYE